MASTAPKKPPVKQKPSFVAQVLMECGGVTKDAAKKLKMTEGTVRAYIRKYPSCKEAREDAMIDLKEIAGDTLINLVKYQDRQATFFVLSRFRQKDGTWTARQDDGETGAGGGEESIEME